MNTEANTGVEIPETFDLNEADTDRPPMSRLRETGKDQIYKGVIVSAKKSVATNKKNPAKSTYNMQIELTLRALTPANDPVGPETRKWVDVPVPNPLRAGHKPYPDADMRDLQFGRARELIRAVMGDDALPAFPKKREGGSAYFDPATGNDLTVTEQQALAKTIDNKTIAILQGWYTTPATLTSTVVYFGTKKNDAGYVNASYLRHDDGSKAVITENFTEVVA